ncbi:NCS2 family nucleobase:cation symporter [Alicyclobacillus fastidiosus]|uniref:NCS2 family nucleobase:cation symporter n=1 Tax=Alicyclobacillus fastidiosus TaxID=392011 RepID=A0ABY6ZES7_9BACL|nr:solute carrier family 23 protein [Alicyclobacillus fastidiosus]WAH41002.1 NCS2 family nucleobase:cation symporter [Alicyclobacillus fastidiosus]GMA62517.1 uracil transporter [Alicyclobacillus fastidiosus]
MRSFVRAIPLSFQHVFAMFGATVLVPFLTGLDPGSTLVASGVGTIIFHLITRGKVPTYLGSSFAFIAPLTLFVTKQHAPGQAVTGLISVSIVYGILSLVIASVGVQRVRKAIPPVVVGPVVAIIGLSLAQTAIQSEASTHWDVAIVSLLAAILASLVGPKQMRLIPILFGIVIGYVYSIIRGGLVDFSGVRTASWVQFPHFHAPTFSWSVILAMAPIALVTFVEDLGHMFVLNEITEKDVVKNPGFPSILLGNGVATFVSALLGGPAQTTYAENLGVLAMTRQFSSRIIQGAAVIAIILGLLGKFGALIHSIPTAVMGGIGILLYGMIAAMGIRHMIEEKVNLANMKNLIIVAVIFIVGVGYANNGIAYATIAGLLIYWLIPNLGNRAEK